MRIDVSSVLSVFRTSIVAGSIFAFRRVGRGGLAAWLGAGVALFGAPLALIGLIPEEAAAILLLAVVGIGTSIESSVLVVANLVDLGTKQIWAKAITPAHGKILQRIGAHHVVYPEAEAGYKVAHLVSGKLMDYIEFDDDFAIVKMRPPRETQGFTLGQSEVRKKYGVTIVGVKSPGEDFTYAVPSTKVSAHDTLIVSGPTTLIERLASRP